jgi:hypothetical protein
MFIHSFATFKCHASFLKAEVTQRRSMAAAPEVDQSKVCENVVPTIVRLCLLFLCGVGVYRLRPIPLLIPFPVFRCSSTVRMDLLMSELAILEKVRLIAHACGPLGKRGMTNSKEALLLNYKNGHRFFEVDLVVNQYKEIYCAHDLPPAPSNATFVEVKASFARQYTMMDLGDLARVVREHRDMFIVTDLKMEKMRFLPQCEWFWKNFVSKIKEVGEEVLKQMIPMISAPEAYRSLVNAWNWTLMGIDFYGQPRDISKWAELIHESNSRLKIITMSSNFALRDQNMVRELRAAGGLLFPYSINDVQWIRQHSGPSLLSGYYTDRLIPSPEITAYFGHDSGCFYRPCEKDLITHGSHNWTDLEWPFGRLSDK